MKSCDVVSCDKEASGKSGISRWEDGRFLFLIKTTEWEDPLDVNLCKDHLKEAYSLLLDLLKGK